MSTCPFVLTRGLRKGEICGVKNKIGSSFCRYHQDKEDNKVIKESDPLVVKQIDGSYVPPIIKDTKKHEDHQESEFIKAFSKHVDANIGDNDANMDLIYEDSDDNDEDYDDSIQNEYSRVDDPEVARLKKQVEDLRSQQEASQKYIRAMFTMKQVMFAGLKVVTETAESFYPDGLQGYTKDVLVNDEINAILDEMARDLEQMVGYSDMPSYIRLPLSMCAIASTTALRNRSGIIVKPPQNEVPPSETINNDQPLPEDKFQPAYKE